MNPRSGKNSYFPGERKILFQLCLIGFFAIFSTTISKNPVLPLFVHALGAGDATIGLISAVSPFAGILFSFPVGVISDRLGRKRLLVFSGFVFLIAPLCYLFITNPAMLIPIRFFHGLGTAILGPVASAVIVERFPDKKGEMLGQYSSATLVGRTIAPLVGGIIISLFAGYSGLVSYEAVYLVAFLTAIPVLLLTFLYKDENKGTLAFTSTGEFAASFRIFFGNRTLRATAAIEMSSYFSFGAFETFLPVFLFGKGFAAYEIGILFSVQVILIALTKPLFGWMADRMDKRIQILSGLFLMSVPVAIIPLFSDFWSFAVISLISGLGLSLSTVATGAYVADVARKKEIGASMGALSSTMDIGHSLGPLVTGLIIGTGLQYGPGFFVGFLLSLIVGVFFFWSVFTREKN